MAYSQPRATFGLPAPGAGANVLTGSTTRLPFYFATILLFIHFGRLFDTILVGYKIPAVVCSVAIVVMLFNGGLKLLRSRVGVAFLLLVAWMCVSAPFSTWKAATLMYVLWYAQFFLPLMLLVAIACVTPRDVLKLSFVLALSLLFHLLINGSDAVETGGRYALNGTFGNPDDVALLAGFAIPFVALVCGRLRNPVASYGLLSIGCGYLLWLIGKTATRAAIPALLVMLALYLVRSKGVQKLAILAFACGGALFVILILPANTMARLSTVVDAFSPQSHFDGSEAEASALDRHELMRDAIKATLEHPIVGVGASMFIQYRFDHMMSGNGAHKRYEPSHNTYLQIASEIGIPGVICYLLFLWAIHSQIRATRKLVAGRTGETAELIQSITLCVEAALLYFAVCAAFMTCDRHPHQFVLAGFAIAMQKMAPSWLAGIMPASTSSFSPMQMATVPVLRKRSFPVGTR